MDQTPSHLDSSTIPLKPNTSCSAANPFNDVVIASRWSPLPLDPDTCFFLGTLPIQEMTVLMVPLLLVSKLIIEHDRFQADHEATGRYLILEMLRIPCYVQASSHTTIDARADLAATATSLPTFPPANSSSLRFQEDQRSAPFQTPLRLPATVEPVSYP